MAAIEGGGMQSTVVIALTAAFFSAVALLLFCAFLAVYRRWRRARIRKHGQRYLSMQELCNRYQFEEIPMANSMFRCESKAEYDRFDFQKFFEEVVEHHIDDLRARLNAAKRNELKLISFEQDVAQLPRSAYKAKGWIAEEDALCEALQPKPTCGFKLRIDVFYVSPKGRNSYEKKKVYSGADVLSSWNAIQKRRAEEKTRQEQIRRERSKVTPGLRYEVMQRDGCRCQICGSSQSDGVKLHVDHIIPVSKGGKTTMANLQTLCDRCNLGKSDKL